MVSSYEPACGLASRSLALVMTDENLHPGTSSLHLLSGQDESLKGIDG
jgi:hypothetical protein